MHSAGNESVAVKIQSSSKILLIVFSVRVCCLVFTVSQWLILLSLTHNILSDDAKWMGRNVSFVHGTIENLILEIIPLNRKGSLRMKETEKALLRRKGNKNQG